MGIMAGQTITLGNWRMYMLLASQVIMATITELGTTGRQFRDGLAPLVILRVGHLMTDSTFARHRRFMTITSFHLVRMAALTNRFFGANGLARQQTNYHQQSHQG
jgi:hypothetical protein